ncbi:MAG: hypothetical protein Q4D72_11535 [Capnocytophaga sp.]|nr:hypothetical protein [Capnocytophaga sp.]
MVKKFILGLSIVGLVACGSDSKDDTLVMPPVQENLEKDKIVKIEEYFENQLERVIELAYDTNKRLNKVTENRPQKNQKIETEIAYPQNKVLITYKENQVVTNLAKPTLFEVDLDTQQRVVQLKKTRSFKNSTRDEVTTETGFVYDATSRQIKSKTSFFPEVLTSWNGNTLVKIESKNSKGETEVTQTYDYMDTKNTVYPDLNFFLTRFTSDTEIKFLFTKSLGLRSEHYLQKYTYMRGTSKSERNISYEFDQKLRPTSVTVDIQEDVPSKYTYKIFYAE